MSKNDLLGLIEQDRREELKRYDPAQPMSMDAVPHGEWVRYADAVVAIEQARREGWELLEALEEAVIWDAYDSEDVPAVWLEKARTAIEKVRGGRG